MDKRRFDAVRQWGELSHVTLARRGLYKVQDRSAGMPPQFAALGYSHFGDPDFYNGVLYVPITSRRAKPAVLAYDEDLNLLGWGTLDHGGEVDRTWQNVTVHGWI